MYIDKSKKIVIKIGSSILVDGKDLFGLQAVDGGSVSCRNWSARLPEINDLRLAMKNNE